METHVWSNNGHKWIPLGILIITKVKEHDDINWGGYSRDGLMKKKTWFILKMQSTGFDEKSRKHVEVRKKECQKITIG